MERTHKDTKRNERFAPNRDPLSERMRRDLADYDDTSATLSPDHFRPPLAKGGVLSLADIHPFHSDFKHYRQTLCRA